MDDGSSIYFYTVETLKPKIRQFAKCAGRRQLMKRQLFVISGSVATLAACSNASTLLTPQTDLGSQKPTNLTLPAGYRQREIFKGSGAQIVFEANISGSAGVRKSAASAKKALTEATVVSPAYQVINSKNGIILVLYNLVLTFSDKTTANVFVDPSGSTLYTKQGSGGWGQWSVGLVKGNDGNVWASAVKVKSLTFLESSGGAPGAIRLTSTNWLSKVVSPSSVDTCAQAASIMAIGALQVLSVVGSAAVADAATTVGAVVGGVLGSPLGPPGVLVGADFGAVVGAYVGGLLGVAVGSATYALILKSPYTGSLLNWVFDDLCDKLTSPPAAPDGGAGAAPANYADSVWSDPSQVTAAVGTLGGGTWQTDYHGPLSR